MTADLGIILIRVAVIINFKLASRIRLFLIMLCVLLPLLDPIFFLFMEGMTCDLDFSLFKWRTTFFTRSPVHPLFFRRDKRSINLLFPLNPL
jgi:hypothetical protein